MAKFLMKSEIPVFVNVNQNNFSLFNEQKILETQSNSDFDFSFFFQGKSQIFCEKIFYDGKNFLSKNSFSKIIKLDFDNYILEICEKNCCFLQKKVKKIKKNSLIFSFYQNGLVEIESENESLFSEQYDFEILDANVLELKEEIYALQLFGKNGFERGIIIKNNASQLFFESACIEKTENGFKVLTNFFDIACHGLVEVYQIGDEITKIDEYSVYLRQKPQNSFNQKVLPVYFLECVKAKDFDEAKNCLSNELQKKVKVEHLKKYFADFVKIIPLEDKIFLEYYDNQNKIFFTRKFLFLQNADKIENVKEL